jgi:hypothetical protein
VKNVPLDKLKFIDESGVVSPTVAVQRGWSLVAGLVGWAEEWGADVLQCERSAVRKYGRAAKGRRTTQRVSWTRSRNVSVLPLVSGVGAVLDYLVCDGGVDGEVLEVFAREVLVSAGCVRARVACPSHASASVSVVRRETGRSVVTVQAPATGRLPDTRQRQHPQQRAVQGPCRANGGAPGVQRRLRS